MADYLKTLPADYEDYPRKWFTDRTPKDLQNELVEVARENIAMLDGNTAHLIATSSSINELLADTHRSPLHDTKANCAPDAETVFRLYDECEGGVSMKCRRTINSGDIHYQFWAKGWMKLYSMVKAKRSEVGLFELPNETRKFPSRPCDRRQQVLAPTNIQQTTDGNVKMFRVGGDNLGVEAINFLEFRRVFDESPFENFD